VLELPKFAVIAVIFIGSLFLFLQFLNMAFKYLSAWRASDGQRKGLEEIKNLN
jgi:hypothetical protein